FRTPQLTEDQVALAFLQGRYVTPVTCKKTDGSSVDVESSIGIKFAPDSGGGNAARITFFGIDLPDIAYCYNVVERRVIDRRGSILVHFQSFNRSDKGLADFKIAAKRGPLEYPSHRGEVTEKPLGTQGEGETRTLSFEGQGSKLVVETVSSGSDGAKLLSVYPPTAPARLNAPDERKRLTLRFHPVAGDPFVVYVIDEVHTRK
ncbi:MAG TPA: hypothetical protein VMS22_20610, partial [Candidatus Eisenbacteria bacterium]|nr:hypothetical protein [Candidatus Eisenbacteria bacterium]